MDQFDFEYLKFQYGKENLSDIYSMELDQFWSVTTNEVSGQSINLYELFQKIRSNLLHEITPTILLTNKYVNGEKCDRYTEIKKTLPVVCYNATFNRIKNDNNIKTITNLMFLDIDDFENKEDAEEYKQQITKKYKWIVGCYHSLSKLGLHLIIVVDAIHSSEDFKQKYEYINEQYFNSLLDLNAKRITQYSILPFDFDIYINENPSILHIDKEFQEYQKSASSGNIKRKIITSTCTFSSGDLNHEMNVAARDHGLRFSEDQQIEWDDPNVPIYYPDGLDVIEVNLYLLFNYKVSEGNRNKAIGKLSMKLIYLNPQEQYHDQILKFVVKMNQMICTEPLTHKEVLNSFEANWKKHQDGELDVSTCFNKRRFFWSPKCTLKGKEKRTLAAQYFQGNRKQQSLLKIEFAIEDIYSEGQKIKQKDVIELSGLSPRTIKTYWDQFKGMVDEMNLSLRKSGNSYIDAKVKSQKQRDIIGAYHNPIDKDHPVSEISEGIYNNPTVNDTKQDSKPVNDIKNNLLTDEQKTSVFKQVMKPFLYRLDERQEQKLYKEFTISLHNLPHKDIELLITPLDKIENSESFWRRSSLENKFWELYSNINEQA